MTAADVEGIAKAAFLEGWSSGHYQGNHCPPAGPCRHDAEHEWDYSEIRRHLQEISYTPPPEEGG